MTAAIPPWRRDYPMDRNQIQFNWLVPPPLAPLPTKPDTHKVLLQLAAEHEQRIQQQYAQQRDHLRRTEYERKAQPITLSSSTRTTAITTTTTMTTTSAPPFVLSKEPPLANERSPHRHEDNAIVFDRRLYDEHEGRRRHEELLRKEQLMIVERARAQAAARSRLLKQNVTKPRAWLQVGLMDARAFDNRRAPPVLTVRNYRPFDLNSIPSDAAERSTTTETVIRHSTATSGTESQHDIQIDTVMNSSDADGEEENKKSATSITTTPRTTITLITAATETLPSSTLSDAMTKKIPLNPTTSVALPTTTTTTTSTARTTSTVRTTSESPTTTTTTSTSTTTAITTIISKAHSNHQRVFIPAQNVTRAFRQKVTKSKLDDASIASSSTVFLAVIIAFVSFLS
uniref:Uncharacterized protein n=1 Tax=Angiostrongylus cantonensis TaxID=6313 RepID=A0A0K0DF47_ANGCA